MGGPESEQNCGVFCEGPKDSLKKLKYKRWENLLQEADRQHFPTRQNKK